MLNTQLVSAEIRKIVADIIGGSIAGAGAGSILGMLSIWNLSLWYADISSLEPRVSALREAGCGYRLSDINSCSPEAQAAAQQVKDQIFKDVYSKRDSYVGIAAIVGAGIGGVVGGILAGRASYNGIMRGRQEREIHAHAD